MTAGTPGETPFGTELADSSERLSADDQATQREAQFRAAALLRHRQASTVAARTPGVCANCAQQCLPLAVYCDDECRAEHERRQAVLRRQGRAA